VATLSKYFFLEQTTKPWNNEIFKSLATGKSFVNRVNLTNFTLPDFNIAATCVRPFYIFVFRFFTFLYVYVTVGPCYINVSLRRHRP